MITWQDITVGKFQEIHQLSLMKAETEFDEIAKSERLIGLAYNLTPEEVDELPMLDFKAKLVEIRNLLKVEQIPGKAETSFRIGGKSLGKFKFGGHKFFLTYDIGKMKQRQFVELLTYGQSPIENMHRILASMVQPVKGWFKKRALPNNVEQHAEMSALMQEAPVTIVYHSAVFFCKLYTLLLKVIQNGTVKEMMQMGIQKEIAEELYQISINTMDGFIQPNKLQSLKG